MNIVTFPEIRHDDTESSVFERFNSEDAKKFFRNLFASIVGSDIYSAYLDTTISQIMMDAFDTDEGIRNRINELKGAEIPFIITADSDFESGLPTDFHLQRFNPSTGIYFFDGWASFADYQNMEKNDNNVTITGGYGSFNREQSEMLLSLTNMQMSAGIDPRVAYSDVMFGFSGVPAKTV